MPDVEEFSVQSARDASARDELNRWVADFLSSPGSDNAALAEALTSPRRWWLGPVQVPFSELNRLAGPPGEPALAPLKEEDVERAEDMAESVVEEGWEPPPLIVSFRNSQLVLEDGNHRVEGLRRIGHRDGWCVIGFEDPDGRDSFRVPPGDPS